MITTDRKNRKKIIHEAKNKPCADCGISYPFWVMEFDHAREKKTECVSQIWKHVGTKKLLQEIAKCDVVCANCHKTRTHNRRVLALSSSG